MNEEVFHRRAARTAPDKPWEKVCLKVVGLLGWRKAQKMRFTLRL
jgi:hypothetical protein